MSEFVFNNFNLKDEFDDDNIKFEEIGYIEYGRYKIYINIMKNISGAYAPDIDLAIEAVCTPSITKACINIGEYIWNKADKKDIKNLLYHEFAHIHNQEFFDENHADEFAVAHVGATKYTDSLQNLLNIQEKYHKMTGLEYTPYLTLGRYQHCMTYRKRIYKKLKMVIYKDKEIKV